MKKLFCVLCILFPIVFILSCKQITETTEEITQVNYIVPVWKGSLPTAPSNPKVGWAYYNTAVKKSFVYDGSEWQIMAQDGTDGTGITWKGELSSAPSNPKINWAYYNTIDGNSYIYNGTSWDYLAKSGRDGASGILLWLGSYDTVPENPSEGWAYYDTTNQTSYIWNGMNWDTLSVSLGGDTTVTVGITWLGTFDSAPLSPLIGYAYYNSTAGASYIYDGSVWQQISKDGANGTNGTSTAVTGYLITWKGSYASAPSNPKAGWAYYNTSAKKSYIYDGSTWQIMAQDGADGASGTNTSSSGTDDTLVYMGESSEKIDSIIYTVKSYASVYASEPYFYTYYKYYYLNEKLRRAYVFYHSIGSDLDYKYTEFVEHTCGNSSGLTQVYTYYENGKLKSYIQNLNSNGTVYKYEYFYDSDGNKNYQKFYQDGNLYNEIYYYTNGTTKIQNTYKTDVSPSYLYSKRTYYENGKDEYSINYSSEGTETSKSYYTYYDNGNKKTYNSWINGILDDSYSYYDDASTTVKSYFNYDYSTGILSSEKYNYSDGTKQLYISYNSDTTIDSFNYHYISGYTQYYYTDSGYFYTYEDGKTTSTPTNTSYYSSKTAYTVEQANSKLTELKSSL